MITSELDSEQKKTERIRIMLADDHPLLRKALRGALEEQADFEVIAEAKDGQEAVALATELLPDVLIMDISMPRINGLEATREIKANCPSIAVLVLTIHNDNEHVVSLLQAGAAGYLTKSVDDMEIVNAIRALVYGETVLSHEVSKQILKYAFQNMPKAASSDINDRLSVREMEILRLLSKGITNKDIALRLDLSMRTIKGYLADLFVKLNVASRTEGTILRVTCG